MLNGMNGIARLKNYRSKRISSYDQSGGNNDNLTIKSGEKTKIAEIEGSGIIKHIWFTIACGDPMYRRNIILRMYWDGEESPSVEAPIGDFFGQGWGEHYNYASLPLAVSPKQGRGLNCYFPMPFAEEAVIEIENESENDMCIYFYIDYEEHQEIPVDMGRFHAWWNREITEPAGDKENEWSVLGPEPVNRSDQENYLIADIKGKGHFAGINYFIDNPGPIWYGEGDDMWIIDGEEWPGSLHGTGTEDLFNSSWSPNELYEHPYFGYARVPDKLEWMGRTHCYRFFIEDPVAFEESLRVSIEHGHANVLTLDICTVAYWYQQEPHRAFPLIPSKNKRKNMPEIGAIQVHRWREAWREKYGRGKLWGDENEK